MKPLILCIIPGLGSEGVDPNAPATIPQWCNDLQARVVASDLDPVQIFIANYTNRDLPEWLAAMQKAAPDSEMAIVGHSDGGACAVWIADHAVRHSLALRIDFLFLLDPVTDFIRHGPLAPLPYGFVGRAVTIFQTADPLIHPERVRWNGGEDTERYSMDFFGQPGANHGAVAASERVQKWIVAQLTDLVSED